LATTIDYLIWHKCMTQWRNTDPAEVIEDWGHMFTENAAWEGEQ